MKRILLFLLLAIALTTLAVPAFAADPITVSSNNFVNNFPDRLVFQVDAQSAAQINDVALFVQFDGVDSSVRQIPEFTKDTKISVKYEWSLLTANYVPAGVTGEYWWTIQDEAGNKIQTPKQSFRIDDPRRQWKKIANDKLAIYWYSGNDSFGKSVFDRATQSMETLAKDTGLTIDHQIQILIYGDRNEFLKALGPTVKGTEGGVTFSNYLNGVVLINFDTDNLQWGLGATTHEMTHVIMGQKVHSPLGEASFPLWLNEGLAVYYETNPGTLTTQFSIPLRRAIQNDTAYPLRSLSGYFSSTSSAQELAYGQSYSIVDFIYRKFGRDKMAQLLQEIKKGGTADDIFQKVLNVNTDGLDNAWRQDVGLKPRAIPTRNTSQPTAFPTFGLSTDNSTPVPAAQATATPQSVAQNSASSSSRPSSQAPNNPGVSVQLCNGSMAVIVLGLFGMVWSMKRRAP